MSGYLLDTNVVSESVKPAPNSALIRWLAETDEALTFLSVLTLGEIRKGAARLSPGARRSRIENWLDKELRERFVGRILVVDEEVAHRWGRMTAISAAKGTILPVIDGLLAATAQQHNLILVTRNVADVAATGVEYLCPWG